MFTFHASEINNERGRKLGEGFPTPLLFFPANGNAKEYLSSSFPPGNRRCSTMLDNPENNSKELEASLETWTSR